MSNNKNVFDREKLRCDLKTWQGIEYSSFGVLSIVGLSKIQLKYSKYADAKIYYVTKGMYFLFYNDLSRNTFYKKYSELRKDLKNPRMNVSIYQVFSDEEPKPKELIEQALKLIQVNEYNKNMNGSVLELLNELEKQKYEVYLQPKQDYQNSTIIGAEALIRYRLDDKILPPSYFIAELEHKGLIYYIDIYVFEKVCQLIARWQKEKREIYPISLNFSKTTLLNAELIEEMNKIADQYRIDHSLIEIEITESLGNIGKELLQEVGKSIDMNGYRLSLDDFGVEYSNAIVLAMLPFKSLKLDKCISRDMLKNQKLQIIIKEIVILCDKLGIQLIAEGIENEEQFLLMKKMGCQKIQGYYLSRPLDIVSYESRFNQKENKEINEYGG